MNDHNKLVSGVETTANPAPSKGRRRLVKGAMLATPAVMTLMSGRLMAATSLGACGLPVTPNYEDGIQWVDLQNNQLQWGNIGTATEPQWVLGYGTGDSFQQYTGTVVTTTSCWASTGNPLNPLNPR